MVNKMNRRKLLAGLTAVTVVPGCATSSGPGTDTAARIRDVELRAGGRLGVCFLDTRSGSAISYRGDQRFGMCSTFKLPLAAVILAEAELGRLALDTFVTYNSADMVPYAPVTSLHLKHGGMTIGELAEAIQVNGDNPAANLLLETVDGPEGFTLRLREAGDQVTRLDRYEVALNFVPPGEIRDTTTPDAMARTVAHYVAGSGLNADSQALLKRWLIDTRTGLKRLRAGLPAHWVAGDKTGSGLASGMDNKYNDVAVVWPERGSPVVIAAYYEAPGEFAELRSVDEAVLARVGEIAAEWITERPA